MINTELFNVFIDFQSIVLWWLFTYLHGVFAFLYFFSLENPCETY